MDGPPPPSREPTPREAGPHMSSKTAGYRYGKGFATETPLGRGRVPEFLWVLVVFGWFPLVSVIFSHLPLEIF